jgi:hypothetical protein
VERPHVAAKNRVGAAHDGEALPLEREPEKVNAGEDGEHQRGSLFHVS